MERGKPTAEHMAALYELINEPLAGRDVFYTEEELEELRERGEATWV